MVNGTDDNLALIQSRIEDLNKVRVSSLKETIEILDELRIIKGKIITGSVLERSVKNYLGSIETKEITDLIHDLTELEKTNTNEIKKSIVDEGKIRELVEEYRKYTEENSFSDKEALDQIYRENKNSFSAKEIETFLQNERNNYQKRQGEVKKEIITEETPKEEIKREENEYKPKFDNEVKPDLKNIVDQKIEQMAEKTKISLAGDDNFKEIIKEEIREIINEDKVITNSEQVNDLSEVLAKELKLENNSEIKIEAKKTILEIEKFEEEKVNEVYEFRKEEFENKFIEETQKINPELTSEELVKVKEYAKLIADNVLVETVIDGQKETAILANNQEYSPGKLDNAWTDLKTTTNFLTKKSEEIKEIKVKYNSIKNSLSRVNLPENFKNARSFEKVISYFNNQGSSQLFGKTQNYLNWTNRIDKLTGGWLNKTFLKSGEKLIGKIGNQAVKDFASNALGTLAKEGFSKGIQTVLKGILGGGVKTAATTIIGGTVGAAVSATGLGAIVVAAVAVGKKIVKFIGKISEKLGISFKKGLQENFGKVGGTIINAGIMIVGLPFLLLGSISTVIIAPVILLVFGGLFVYQQFIISPMVASLVPPKGGPNMENSAVWTGGCVNVNYPTTVNSKIENGIQFYIFEPDNRNENGRMRQIYDLACVDGNNLVLLGDEYTLYPNDKSEYRVDKRILPAFYALYEAGKANGLGGSELKLNSGYRTNDEEAIIRQEWRNKIAAAAAQGVYSENDWNCSSIWTDSYYQNIYPTLEEKIEGCTNLYAAKPGSSSHTSGRALDLVVNNSDTYDWLIINAAKYGFYNYSREDWHWEYNPTP